MIGEDRIFEFNSAGDGYIFLHSWMIVAVTPTIRGDAAVAVRIFTSGGIFAAQGDAARSFWEEYVEWKSKIT